MFWESVHIPQQTFHTYRLLARRTLRARLTINNMRKLKESVAGIPATEEQLKILSQFYRRAIGSDADRVIEELRNDPKFTIHKAKIEILRLRRIETLGGMTFPLSKGG